MTDCISIYMSTPVALKMLKHFGNLGTWGKLGHVGTQALVHSGTRRALGHSGTQIQGKLGTPNPRGTLFNRLFYSWYGIESDVRGTFSLPGGSGICKNVIIFGVDDSSANNRKKYTLILGRVPTDGLDNTTITVQVEYSISFRGQQKKFSLTLFYLGGQIDPPSPYGFSRKMYLPKRGWNPGFLWILSQSTSFLKISLNFLKSFRRYEDDISL